MVQTIVLHTMVNRLKIGHDPFIDVTNDTFNGTFSLVLTKRVETLLNESREIDHFLSD